jgi:DNA-binding response OmpR family regulator
VERVATVDAAAELLWPAAGAVHVPDALLLDLGLPVLDDGRSLLHRVRRSPGWGGLPVLMLVGRQPASLIKAAVQQGASGFIQRPFDGLEVVYKMEQALRGGTRSAELVDLARDVDPVEHPDPSRRR